MHVDWIDGRAVEPGAKASVKKYRTVLSENQSLLERLGPGLITGAADDDPSGIATYSQVGAAFGYGILWTAIVTFPLMIGIQIVSARIGRVTGDGIAANIRKHYSPWLLYGLIVLLLVPTRSISPLTSVRWARH